jgi:hypothetical protein
MVDAMNVRGGRPKTAGLLDLAPHPEGGWYRETWRAVLRSASYWVKFSTLLGGKVFVTGKVFDINEAGAGRAGPGGVLGGGRAVVRIS